MPEAASIAELLRDAARIATLQAGYNTSVVLVAAMLLGIAGGLVGAVAMLRNRAMMADTLAHCTLPGIAGAFLAMVALGGSGRSRVLLLVGGTVTAVLGVLAVQSIVRRTRLRDDAAMAAVLSVFFGVGVVLLSLVQNVRTGTQGGLTHFIHGQTAAMSAGDAWLMAAAAGLSALVVLALRKEFRVVCFDDRFAASLGLRVGAIDLVLMALVVVVTVAGLQAVGLILVVAILMIPPAAARLWSDRFGTVVLLSGALGGVSAAVGAIVSALAARAPAGAVIVLSAAGVFALSLLLSPRRGLLGHLLGRRAPRGLGPGEAA